MITIVGTGHIFGNIVEPVSFIVKNTWPDAVLVELDAYRYNAIMEKNIEHDHISKVPKIYYKISRYQQIMSKKYGTQPGEELSAAINTGKIMEADIIPIDIDIMSNIDEMWSEMSSLERTRYRFSMILDFISSKQSVEKSYKKFISNEEAYISKMRRRYPILVHKLIDKRNMYMAQQIINASKRYNNIVVIIGDAHVEEVCKIVANNNIRKIRLFDLMSDEHMNKIRSAIWRGENRV